MTRLDWGAWRTSRRPADLALSAAGGAVVVLCAALLAGWTQHPEVPAGMLGVLALTGTICAPSRCRPAPSRRRQHAAPARLGAGRARPSSPGRSGAAVQQRNHLAAVTYRIGRAAAPDTSKAPRVARGL